MAVTFKSNQVASRYIKDVSGYRGPIDFGINVSFADDLIVDSNWNPVLLSNAISVNRGSQASVLKSADLSDYEIINNDVPRVSYIPDYGSFGLISSNWASAFLGSVTATSAALSAGSNVYSLFTTDIGGSIGIQTNANISILAGSGTFDDPLYFVVNANTTINLIRNNNAQKAHLMLASSGQTPFIPNYEFIGISPDTVQVNPSSFGLRSGAVVFKFASPKRKYQAYNGSDRQYPILLLKQDSDNYVAGYVDAAGKLNIRLYVGGVQRYFVASDESVNRNIVNTIAISWENGALKLFMNGVNFVPFSERRMSDDFSVNSLKIGGSLEGWVPLQSDLCLFNLVTYKRVLSNQELGRASVY